MNLNHIVFAGRLGKNPEIKVLPNGTTIASFSVASDRVWKDANGQKQQDTEWANCSAFGKTAEVIGQYFTKGQEIYIEGRLKTRSWEDTDGKKKYSTGIIVESFQFVGTKNYTTTKTAQPYTPPTVQSNVSTFAQTAEAEAQIGSEQTGETANMERNYEDDMRHLQDTINKQNEIRVEEIPF